MPLFIPPIIITIITMSITLMECCVKAEKETVFRELFYFETIGECSLLHDPLGKISNNLIVSK